MCDCLPPLDVIARDSCPPAPFIAVLLLKTCCPSLPTSSITSGLVAVTKGYDILVDIKAEGGIFRREAIGDLVEEKSWIISCVDDADARQVAKTLKKRARKRGLKANVRLC